MPKERDLVLIIIKNFISSLMPRKFTGELKGTDRFGTKYFEISKGGNRRKMSRYFEPIGKDDNFDQEVPGEWESWLRGRRKDPPTEEELKKNYELMLQKREKAKEIDAKFKNESVEQPKPVIGTFPKYSDYDEAIGSGSYVPKDKV